MRRRSRSPEPPSSNEPRSNQQIRVPRVLLIDEEGTKLGEFLTRDALSRAQDAGMDLVEVSPNASPPVCKIMDFGKYKFHLAKREKEKRQNQKMTTIKEVRLRPKTDEHDIMVVVKKARKFLSAGHKVKVVIRFRGREHAHRDLGAAQCDRLLEEIKDIGAAEGPPKMEGRIMQMLVAPL